MSTVEIKGVSKSFGDTEVLKGVDLSVREGEFLTLVGPSGCGKSTLLRIIAGLEAQTAGDIQIGATNVNGVRAADRNLAMVFQSYALYPHLTVAENMLTPLKLRDLSFKERLPILGPLMARARHNALRAQVAETARVLKIEALLDRKPGQLSGGQRQRAALGRAMVRKPVAFLMDEPLSNLDAALRVHMRAELSELHRSLGATFIYVTHDQAEALTMSDRMAVMMDGDILQLDRPETIYNSPASLQVAEFVGAPKINTLPGEVNADGWITCMGEPLSVKASPRARSALTIGVRPEHLNIVVEETALSGTVRHRENLGSDVYLHLSVGDLRVIVRTEPAAALNVSLEDRVHLSITPGAALVFTPTGARLPLATCSDAPADAGREAAA